MIQTEFLFFHNSRQVASIEVRDCHYGFQDRVTQSKQHRQMKSQWSGTYSVLEGYTAGGQLVSFTARSGSGDEIKRMLEENVRNIYFPTTKSLTHGGLGSSTRYDIDQHEYGGGDGDCGGGYIEVLHIGNAPDGHCPFVIHQYMYECPSGMGYRVFSEWKTLEDAIAARKGQTRHTFEKCKDMPGFIRFVDCGELIPWFYAIGNQMIYKDFAVHPGFEDHPVYRLGKKFMITSDDGVVRVATCMGALQYSYQSERGLDWKRENKFYWVVMFSDGTNLHLDADDVDHDRSMFGNRKRTIQALPEGEVWQVDLLMQFWALISGKKLGGSIKFVDGSSLTMKFRPKGKTPPDAPGKYQVKATRKSGTTNEGVVEFDPEQSKAETVVEMVLQRRLKVDPEDPYVKVEVKKRLDDVSKKWRGIWHAVPNVLKDSST